MEIVSSLIDEWNAHELDAVYAGLSEDYKEYINGVLVKVGPARARAVDADLYEMIPDYRRTVDELWGLDDRVVSRFVISRHDARRREIRVGSGVRLRHPRRTHL